MKDMICIVCPRGCHMKVTKQNGEHKISGATCKRGEGYAVKEITNPERTLTSTIKIYGGMHPRLPIKTSSEIPKQQIFNVMNIINELSVKAPVKVGQVVAKNVLDLGIDIIATKNMSAL